MERKNDSIFYPGLVMSFVDPELALALEPVSNSSHKQSVPSRGIWQPCETCLSFMVCVLGRSSYLSHVAMRLVCDLSCQIADLAAGSQLLDLSMPPLHHDFFLL